MRPTTPLLLIMLAGVACGGATFLGEGDAGTGDGGASSSGSTSTSSGSGGGSGGSGSTSGSSSGGSSGGSSGALCPNSPPPQGTPCADNSGIKCEWGTGNDPFCDDVVEDCKSGSWQNPFAGAGACASSPPIACPAAYASVPRMTHCPAYGGWCDYPEGRCACTVVGGPAALDASAEAIWICQDPSAPGCPSPRPRLGTTCSQEGLSCDYGECELPGGIGELCQGGVWIEVIVPCVRAGAGARSR